MELDIYLPDKNIAIEYNGYYYHSLQNVKEKDTIKRNLCKKNGILLVVVCEKEWKENRSKIISKIKDILCPSDCFRNIS